MTDWHVHIGQYYDSYYDFHDVFKVLKMNGIDEAVCAYLMPKFEHKKDALDFYNAVEEELKIANEYVNDIALKVHFLYWADPLVLKEFSLETIFFRYPYFGIALHPRLHHWTADFSNLLTHIFSFSKKSTIPVFIHTGISEADNPLQFEDWFKKFPSVEVHLAHCKESNAIIQLFSKYENLWGDTAFCPKDSYEKICQAGFKDRMLFGSDFPITHWYEHKEDKICNFESLNENYKYVLENMVKSSGTE